MSDGNDGEDDLIASSQRTVTSEVSTSSAINTAVEKGRLPTIAYWIGFESPNGAQVSLVRLQRNLLNCEVEINTKLLSARPGTSASHDLTKRLCTVLKDHNSSYIGDIVNDSFEKCFDKATSCLDRDDDLEIAREELREHAVRFVLVNGQNSQWIRQIFEALIKAGLKLDVRGFASGDVFCHRLTKSLTTDKCTQVINDIEILMQQLGYAVHQGIIYKRNPVRCTRI